MSMYNLIEYSDNYSKTFGKLWQYYKNEPNDNLTDSQSFKFRIKITGNSTNRTMQFLENFSNSID